MSNPAGVAASAPTNSSGNRSKTSPSRSLTNVAMAQSRFFTSQIQSGMTRRAFPIFRFEGSHRAQQFDALEDPFVELSQFPVQSPRSIRCAAHSGLPVAGTFDHPGCDLCPRGESEFGKNMLDMALCGAE